MSEQYRFPLFWPHIPNKEVLLAEIEDTLGTRWIGQGPKVEEFEEAFKVKFGAEYAVAVNSCTSALHLAYILAGISRNRELNVISPVFTCTATNHTLLYQDAKIHFCDVDPNSLNPDPAHARQLCEKNDIGAIVAVHIGGDPCDIDGFLKLGEEYDIPVIFDAAQSLGAKYNGTHICSWKNCGFATCYSFQAVKHITTGDGGMLALPLLPGYMLAKRLRWFGIDREARRDKFNWKPWTDRGITVDQSENGYKYQMTDIAACFGLTGLKEVDTIVSHRRQLAYTYREKLKGVSGIELLRDDTETPRWKSSYSLFGLLVENRDDFCRLLESRGVETNTVQLRNDIYQIFGGKRQELPSMNKVEEQYVYLPMNTVIKKEDVEEICDIIKKGW